MFCQVQIGNVGIGRKRECVFVCKPVDEAKMSGALGLQFRKFVFPVVEGVAVGFLEIIPEKV